MIGLAKISQYLYKKLIPTTLPNSSAIAMIMAGINDPINNCEMPLTENHAEMVARNKAANKTIYLNIVLSQLILKGPFSINREWPLSLSEKNERNRFGSRSFLKDYDIVISLEDLVSIGSFWMTIVSNPSTNFAETFSLFNSSPNKNVR